MDVINADVFTLPRPRLTSNKVDLITTCPDCKVLVSKLFTGLGARDAIVFQILLGFPALFQIGIRL